MKNAAILCTVLLLSFSQAIFGQSKFQLSSHILDITEGKPAPQVTITLSRLEKENTWVKVEEKITDTNGRVNDFLKQDGKPHNGIYKLTFFTAPYFRKTGRKSFYPFVEVVFELTDSEHYHVPITLSPFGYSTYRGN